MITRSPFLSFVSVNLSCGAAAAPSPAAAQALMHAAPVRRIKVLENMQTSGRPLGRRSLYVANRAGVGYRSWSLPMRPLAPAPNTTGAPPAALRTTLTVSKPSDDICCHFFPSSSDRSTPLGPTAIHAWPIPRAPDSEATTDR